MAALAGLRIDNCIVQIDANECPGCDGSSQAFVEVLDRAGIVEQGRMRQASGPRALGQRRRRGRHPGSPPRRAGRIDAFLSPRLWPRLAHLGPEPLLGLVPPDVPRRAGRQPHVSCWNRKPNALRAAGIGARATPADLLIFGARGRDRQRPALSRRMRASQDSRHGRRPRSSGLRPPRVRGRSPVGPPDQPRLVAPAARASWQVDEAPAALPRSLGENGVIDITGIMSLLPHRYPFLLVDRVLELDPGHRAVAIKNVSVNEPFFRGHWPGQPIMPGVLIVEALAQAAGVLISASVAVAAGPSRAAGLARRSQASPAGRSR